MGLGDRTGGFFTSELLPSIFGGTGGASDSGEDELSGMCLSLTPKGLAVLPPEATDDVALLLVTELLSFLGLFILAYIDAMSSSEASPSV